MAESSNRQKDIFLKALDLSSPREREAFLAEACGADESLRRQVEAMLQAHAAADSFLEKPAAALELTIDATPGRLEVCVATESPGTRVGPYKLLQQFGEGGMGVVFLAEQQEPVRRMVALKIIKQGMDSAQVVARFESERQALALMDHPNIARVLDAGTTDAGRPYFVMELIKGIPITKFCDQEHLTPRQRLELFIPVCHAVQHAHQKGVIHRDLKPSNVMIARYTGRIHFYAAAAEAMRRTLIDNARKKKSEKRGGQLERAPWHDNIEAPAKPTDDLLAIDEALILLAAEDNEAAQLVKLRFYAGLSVEDAGAAMGLSHAQAYRTWTYAKAWLRTKLGEDANS